jgi:hypothetical protein
MALQNYHQRRIFPTAILVTTPERFGEFVMKCKRTTVDLDIGEKIITNDGLVIVRKTTDHYILRGYDENVIHNNRFDEDLPRDLASAIDEIHSRQLGSITLYM